MLAAAGSGNDALRSTFESRLTSLTARVGAAGRHVRPLVLLGLMVCVFYAPQLVVGSIQYDGVDVHYASQRYFSDAIRSGHLPFWTPYPFAGFPFLADLQVGAWYPLNWPFFLAGITPGSIGGELLLHGLIACCGAYALGVRLLGQPPAAMATAIFYGMSGYFAAHAQHVGMFETAAWLPWLVLLLEVLGERLTRSRLVLAALLGAALALPGHFQVALYAFCGAAVWAVGEALVRRQSHVALRRMVGLLVAGVGGGLLSAVMILPAIELVGQSLRTRLDAAAIGIGYFHPEALLTLVQPDHYGLLSGHYTGPGDSTQHYFYAGILCVPLVLLGLRNTGILRTAMFLGLPFTWYAIGPGGGLFRVVVRLPGFSSIELPMHGWFLPALGLALLGGAGFRVLQARLTRKLIVVPLLLALFVDVFAFNELQNPLAYARQSFLARFGSPLAAFDEQVADAQPRVERVYGPPLTAVGYRNHALQSHVETTYGYNPLELLGYADYADAADINPHLVDGLAATQRILVTPTGGVTLEPNPTALPLAFVVRHLTTVTDEETARARLADLNPADESIVIGQAPAGLLDSDASASVALVESQPSDDSLTMRYRSTTSVLVRVAIASYPGWRATLNGVDLPISKVDDAFLGVQVPPGEADVRLFYAPRFFWPGAVLSLLAALACGGALGLQYLSIPGTFSATSRLMLVSVRALENALRGGGRAERQAQKAMLFLLPLSMLWWPLGLPFGGLGMPLLLNVPASMTSALAYAVVFLGMGLLARRALNA